VSGKRSIWIGYDPRETTAFAVARDTCRKNLNLPIQIYGLLLADLKRRGIYTRPIEMRASAADRPIMWDTVSDAPMSTEHANARFFVPHLAREGWALFTDGDVLFRENVGRLFDGLDRKKAVYCVKHEHKPTDLIKMDGQTQTVYSRKNWSSVIAFNCDHPSTGAALLWTCSTRRPDGICMRCAGWSMTKSESWTRLGISSSAIQTQPLFPRLYTLRAASLTCPDMSIRHMPRNGSRPATDGSGAITHGLRRRNYRIGACQRRRRSRRPYRLW
jgi:hypothetical protein